MVFQDPMSSLNPVIPVGLQVTEVLLRHSDVTRAEARDEATELLRRCGIPDPRRRLKEYPHQMSGGMRQRALIAIALACKPSLLICDEPTTALDVTIQAQVLELLKELVNDLGTAMIMITHDLGVVAGLCDFVNVMYSGRVVESASRRELFAHPRHRYTEGLLASIPRLDSPRGEPLRPIRGTPRDVVSWSQACAFAPRCDHADEACLTADLALVADGPGDHRMRCVHPAARPEGSAEAMSAGDDSLLQVSGPQGPLPDQAGCGVRPDGRSRPGGGRGRPGRGPRADVRPGGGVRLRQVHPGPRTAAAGRADRRLGDLRRHRRPRTLKPEPLRRLRRRMQMVFQDPLSSLNPRQSVESLLVEPLQVHGLSAQDTEEYGRDSASSHLAKAAAMLEVVGLPRSSLSRYPHEFSGGQRQRIGIARAIVLNPDLVIADEPVSALDVSVQAQVINLLEDLQELLGLTYLVIAHDLAVVRHISDTVGRHVPGSAGRGGAERRALRPSAAPVHDRVDVGHPGPGSRRRGLSGADPAAR